LQNGHFAEFATNLTSLSHAGHLVFLALATLINANRNMINKINTNIKRIVGNITPPPHFQYTENMGIVLPLSFYS
jgi:hypothetical protein